MIGNGFDLSTDLAEIRNIYKGPKSIKRRRSQTSTCAAKEEIKDDDWSANEHWKESSSVKAHQLK